MKHLGAAGHDLTSAQLRQLDGRAREVLREDEHARRRVRDSERAVDVHLADSLVALELDADRTAAGLADLGRAPGSRAWRSRSRLPRGGGEPGREPSGAGASSWSACARREDRERARRLRAGGGVARGPGAQRRGGRARARGPAGRARVRRAAAADGGQPGGLARQARWAPRRTRPERAAAVLGLEPAGDPERAALRGRHATAICTSVRKGQRDAASDSRGALGVARKRPLGCT